MQATNKKNLMFSLTWPILVELILQMLMGNIDQMMISKYSQTAVAAVGNANQILNFLVLTFNILCTASIILITQYKGAGNEKEAQRIYALSIVTNLVVSGIISLVIVFGHTTFFRWMSVPKEVLEQSSLYIVITGGFIFLQALSMTYAAILRSNRFMKESMIASVAMNLLNIVGNLILINGWGTIPAMGVAGVAISTTVSRMVGIAIMMVLFRKYVKCRISIKGLIPFPKELFHKLLSVGLPSAGENLAYSLSQLTIMSFVNFFGTVTITVKVYASMLSMVTYIFTSAITQATQVIIGHMIGAKQPDEADKRVRKTLKISMITAFVLSTILLLGSDVFFGLFSSDPEVLRLGRTILLIDLFLEQGRAVNICLVRCLQSTGDIKFPVTIGIFSTWFVAVGFSYLLGVVFNMGIIGIWIAMGLDETLRAVLFLARWKAGNWRQKALV